MKNLQKIQELEAKVNSANTANAEGRQLVANACKELYNTIEEDVYNAGADDWVLKGMYDVYNAGADWMLKGIYNDLCNGNFAEPFMCEQKKTTFLTVAKVYQDNILPRL
jgi:hypothetical protein